MFKDAFSTGPALAAEAEARGVSPDLRPGVADGRAGGRAGASDVGPASAVPPPHVNLARAADRGGPHGSRREPRFLATADRLWMQWWADGEYRGLPATLVNVSRHGAMIVSPVVLPVRQSVRIFLEDAPEPFGPQGIVLGIMEGLSGRHQVRLEFREPCPEAFFEAAAHGFEVWLSGRRPRA